ncbi:hypothetical protein BME96_09060 [Virgibacillus halodenitrificans]|uniref:Uncharacterized protein n=1 Tax=Virgibacillus halodenitrificans TaxID=1482 RepID=A0AAC9IYK9_VIRHA|nr:hypothetical protein [Virgibacillus halodenitrificans]APC48306.1 hypothetical protein BME96_09060 [Virgibacillus halodenitrificans]
MELTNFIWSVIAGVVGTVIVGGAAYKLINKSKTKKVISQKGDSNKAMMDSTLNIYNNKKRNKGE